MKQPRRRLQSRFVLRGGFGRRIPHHAIFSTTISALMTGGGSLHWASSLVPIMLNALECVHPRPAGLVLIRIFV